MDINEDYIEYLEIIEQRPQTQQITDVVVISDDESENDDGQPVMLDIAEFDDHVFLVEDAWDKSTCDSLDNRPEASITEFDDSAFLVEACWDNSSCDSWEIDEIEPCVSDVIVLSDDESADAQVYKPVESKIKVPVQRILSTLADMKTERLSEDKSADDSEPEKYEDESVGELETEVDLGALTLKNSGVETSRIGSNAQPLSIRDSGKSHVTPKSKGTRACSTNRRVKKNFGALRRWAKRQLHECTMCSNNYYLKCNLNKHISLVHRPHSDPNSEKIEWNYQHQCSECTFSSKWKQDVIQHLMAVYKKPKPYKCPECNYRSDSKSSLKIHFLSMHKGYKPFRCVECGFGSIMKSNLKSHIDSVHRNHKPYHCPECDYRTNLKSSITKHIAGVHHKIKPYSCPECDYKTNRTSDVKRHLRTVHWRLRPYQCPECDYRAGQKSSLAMHLLTRHGPRKPLQCSQCNYSASQKRNLQAHIASVHQQCKLFQCTECDHMTNWKCCLDVHISKAHRDKPSQCGDHRPSRKSSLFNRVTHLTA